jgi:hypothetical protein
MAIAGPEIALGSTAMPSGRGKVASDLKAILGLLIAVFIVINNFHLLSIT